MGWLLIVLAIVLENGDDPARYKYGRYQSSCQKWPLI